MSFILDALRKSEHERQRSAVPSLSHVPVATQQHQLPRWTLIVIGTLGAAVLLLAGAWWQSAQTPFGSPAAPVARTERALDLPVAASRAAAPTAVPTTPRLEQPAVAARSLAQAAETEPPQAAPLTGSQAAFGSQAATTPDSGATTLPSAAALAAEGILLPTLRLELHAYAQRPSDRFVFINGRKYVEGERLADGPELVTIEPAGAVLRHLGQRFFLAPE